MNDYLDYKIKTGGDSDGSGGTGPGCSFILYVMLILFIWAVVAGLINLMS